MPSTRKIKWADALRSGQIRVTGPRALAGMLPTWNLRASTPWTDVDAEQSIGTAASG
jgi:hypothetical protein